jgi:uncharacterized radical SAM superfamily Fe-S cluster-containing enzyme
LAEAIIITMLSLFQKKPICTPNILINNFCNQNCPYCFANENMKKSKQKEMSLADFKTLIKIMKKNKVEILRLLASGEPTLHSHFKEIISLGLKNFKEVWIFTNGLISKDIDEFLTENLNNKLFFVFNLNTPIFELGGKKRTEIEDRVIRYSDSSTVYTGFTISNCNQDYSKLYKNFSPDLLKKIYVRFGIMKPIVGEKPFFNPLLAKDRKNVGKQIIKTIENIDRLGVRGITIDCGLMKSMFSQQQRDYLEKTTMIRGWGCDGYWGGFDIDTDLSAIACFPYSQSLRVPLSKENNFRKIQEMFSCRETCFLKTMNYL